MQDYINKENIRNLYLNEKLTTSEIGRIYGVDRTTISNYLKKFGIEIIRGQRKFLETKAYELSQYQKEIMIGSLLGDGSLVCRKDDPYFKVSHCKKQKDYLEWKYESLLPISRPPKEYVDKRGNSIMYQMHTIAHPGLKELYETFYDNKKKIISNKIEISDLSLAVWYMDDGTKQRDRCRFSTEGFSEEENEILLRKIGFGGEIRKYYNYCYIILSKEGSQEMMGRIGGIVRERMGYKAIGREK